MEEVKTSLNQKKATVILEARHRVVEKEEHNY